MENFVKGEIVCSSFDSRYIGVFECIDGDDNLMSCYIDITGNFINRQANFCGFRKTTKEQKEYFKNVLLQYGYSYYKGNIIREL